MKGWSCRVAGEGEEGKPEEVVEEEPAQDVPAEEATPVKEDEGEKVKSYLTFHAVC